jgi:hypothetical protein
MPNTTKQNNYNIIMKILNLSIEIMPSRKVSQQAYLSHRYDFVTRLTQLSEIA